MPKYRQSTEKHYVFDNEHLYALMPFSEVMMHMNVAGKRMNCEVRVTQQSVQLLDENDRCWSIPVTLGEAGFFTDDKGVYLYPPVLDPEYNVWGTKKSDVDETGYCVECEREIPFHYNNCPTRSNKES